MLKKILHSEPVQNLIFYMAYFAITLLCKSCRYNCIGMENVDFILKNQGGVILLWHENLLMPIYSCWHKGIYAMIATSRDGELIARFVEKYGYKLVRGSTRRGGVVALANAINTVKNGNVVTITPDGPIGPRHIIQQGAMAILQKTQTPFVCCGCAISPQVVFKNSWDQHKIPYLFSKCQIYFSKPTYLPTEIEHSEEDIKDFIKKEINKANEMAREIMNGNQNND